MIFHTNLPTYRVAVNGQDVVTTSAELTYEDVVALAGLKGDPSVTWSVWEAQGDKLAKVHRGGILHRGDAVPTVAGMSFRANHTGNA